MIKQSRFNDSKHISPDTYTQREVRDLAWALLSPSLFTDIPDFDSNWFNDDIVKQQTVTSWLHSLDDDPRLLLEHLAQQRSTRLGIYFEQLLSFYFEHFPSLSLIAKNLQVNSKERTLGEFDFIVKDCEVNTTAHIEVAVKFYLGYENYRGKIKKNTSLYNWHNWVGPNHKDTLAIKMRHLSQHQLALSDTLSGKAALEDIIPANETIHHRLFIKGRFYLPLHSTLSMPKYSNPQLDAFYWLTTQMLNQKPTLLNDKSLYAFLPRSLWLSTINNDDVKNYDLQPSSLEEIIHKIENDKEVLGSSNEWQIAELVYPNNEAIELTRFFIINSQNLPFDE